MSHKNLTMRHDQAMGKSAAAARCLKKAIRQGHSERKPSLHSLRRVAIAVVIMAGLYHLGGIGSDDRSQGLLPPSPRIVDSRRRRRLGERRRTPKNDRGAVAASYARYSSSLQRETSIDDQQRECRTMAAAHGHQLVARHEYADHAISGTKRNRAGLNALLAAARAGEFDVLYMHSLSRLARESIITVPIMYALVRKHGIRVICIAEGIDTARDGWELITTIMSLLHEWFLKERSANTRRGRDGAARAGYSLGDACYGYLSEPIPGSDQSRRGRNTPCRKRYAIDPVRAVWVARIFYWFAVENRSLGWICAELNTRQVPKSRYAQVERWYRDIVVRLLKNKKYIGTWQYGQTRSMRDPETGDRRRVQCAADEPPLYTRSFPHLRIISDELFEAAQKRLRANAEKVAWKRAPEGVHKRGSHRLLWGLVKCAECGSTFRPTATGSKYMYCPGYATGKCQCKTKLRRRRVEQMILDALGRQILASPEWIDAVYRVVYACWDKRAPQVGIDLQMAQGELADLQPRIGRLVDKVEKGCAEPDVHNRLELRRAQQRELEVKINCLQKESENIGPPPTKTWVCERLVELSQTLHGLTSDARNALRDLLEGPIVMTQVRTKVRNRLCLQGRFRISSASASHAISKAKVDGQATGADDLTAEIVIDFVPRDRLIDEVERAKALYDQGLMLVEIERELGCGKTKVQRLLRYWSQWNDQPLPAGNRRRWKLPHSRSKFRYAQISEEVKRRWDQGMLNVEIAKELQCGRDLVEKALTYWFSSRGMKKPDGRTRRKSLPRKSS